MLDTLNKEIIAPPALALPVMGTASLELAMVHTAEELEAVQRLRFKIFTQEMQASLPTSSPGLDADEYDPWCEHLMVREQASGRIVGTYRMLTTVNAHRLGRMYSASEFDLSGLG